MVNQLKAMLFNDFFLAALNFSVHKLNYFASIHADHMIVMTTISQLKNGVTTIKVMPHHEASRFKLGQNPVDSRQPYILSSLHQRLINIFRAHVPMISRIKHLQYLQARQSYFQTGLTKFAIFNHGQLSLGMPLRSFLIYGYDRGFIFPAKIVEVAF